MQETYPLINGNVLRATQLDSCGVPAWGDEVWLATEGFISVAVTAEYDDGTEIALKNAKGKNCVKRAAEEELQNLTLAITFCNVNPDLYTMYTGFPKIVNADGVVVGYATNRGHRPVDVSVATELWSDAFADAGCDDDGEIPYGYSLWPFHRGGRVGDYTIENNAVTFSVTGIKTKDGSRWGIGPFDVADDETGAAQALYDAIDALDHEIRFKTLIAPPTPTDTLMPLDDPDGDAATTATAGIPGTFDGVRPVNLAGMTGVTASPATAWTTGQYVTLGDGSKAHWSSTAWVAGPA